MKKTFITLFVIISVVLNGYSINLSVKYTIQGIIKSSASKKTIEYATIALYDSETSELIGGTITNTNGFFKIETSKQATYLLKASFIGFEEKEVENIHFSENQTIVDLGEIFLAPAAQKLDEVTVEETRMTFDYQIDKKVINVNQAFSNASGNAVDILENAPSVKVDIEGNVSLRGSSSFTVLINGTPTVLEATEALEQIPASMIKQIEIITNPSAKYDPEGTSGIINIITKNNILSGINGMVDVKIGNYDNYGGDFLLNYNGKKFSAFIKGDISRRSRPTYQNEESRNTINDTTYYFNSNGENDFVFESLSPSIGFEWKPDTSNTFLLEGKIGKRGLERPNRLNYEEWTSVDDNHRFYSSDDLWKIEMQYYKISFNYKHDFKKKNSNIQTQLMYYSRFGDEFSINSLKNTDNEIAEAKKSTEKGPGGGFAYRLDYVLPFSETNKFEAGLDGKVRSGFDDYRVYNYNLQTFAYEIDSLFSHEVNTTKSTHGAYAIYSGMLNNFGYQLGLRSELTDRFIELKETEENTTIFRFDYFPTIHLSYKLSENNQVMASYTRRINRPRGFYFEPFITWVDAYNVRKGNPELLPEYIDSWELSYQFKFKKNTLTTDVFYRITNHKIESIRLPYHENILMRTFENVGKDYSLGGEFILNLVPVRWYVLDLSGNFFDYRVVGELYENEFSQESFNWGGNITNTFKIKKNTKIQLSGRYESPTVQAQGTREAYFFVNAAVRHSFEKQNLNLTLQARDIFATGKHETIYEAADFYLYNYSEYKAPMISLSVNWRFNNYSSKKKTGDDMQIEE